MKHTFAAAALALLAPFAFSQAPGGGAGHWEGSISLPDHELKILVDLAQGEKDVWKGTISIPEQSLKGFPLSSIAVAEGRVRFAMQGVPGDPAFNGKLAADGQSISGEFTQGAGTLTFSLKRTGEAQFAGNPAIPETFEGSWEGTLDAGGTQLRLVLKLANQEGAATGTLTSLDQNNAVIPITTITQKDSGLKLELPSIGGSYAGEMSKDGSAITGEWTQAMGTLPLRFKRSAAK
jgi:hypothetical protein